MSTSFFNRVSIAVLAMLLLSGCAYRQTVTATPCPDLAGSPMLTAQLFFGLSVPGRPQPVSDTEWRDFTATEITPRFPDGFTVADASGQWFDQEASEIVRERSKVLLIIAEDSADTYRKLDEISSIYKTRFSQQSVGALISRGCASF